MTNLYDKRVHYVLLHSDEEADDVIFVGRVLEKIEYPIPIVVEYKLFGIRVVETVKHIQITHFMVLRNKTDIIDIIEPEAIKILL